MIAVDTNILIYARREEVPEHLSALAWLAIVKTHCYGACPYSAWASSCEAATHPRIFDPPTRLESALEALFGLLASPSLRVLNPGPRYPSLFPAPTGGRRARQPGLRRSDCRGLRRTSRYRTTHRRHDFARFAKLKRLSLSDAPMKSPVSVLKRLSVGYDARRGCGRLDRPLVLRVKPTLIADSLSWPGAMRGRAPAKAMPSV